MKFKWIFLLLTGLLLSTNSFSQKASAPAKTYTPATISKIAIKTSAQCGECKDRIERAMAYEMGVVSSCLNMVNKVITVSYKPSKTTPEKIRIAISASGYDADGIGADAKAYAKLPSCSKKPEESMGDENSEKLSNL